MWNIKTNIVSGILPNKKTLLLSFSTWACQAGNRGASTRHHLRPISWCSFLSRWWRKPKPAPRFSLQRDNRRGVHLPPCRPLERPNSLWPHHWVGTPDETSLTSHFMVGPPHARRFQKRKMIISLLNFLFIMCFFNDSL